MKSGSLRTQLYKVTLPHAATRIHRFNCAVSFDMHMIQHVEQPTSNHKLAPPSLGTLLRHCTKGVFKLEMFFLGALSVVLPVIFLISRCAMHHTGLNCCSLLRAAEPGIHHTLLKPSI